ncbi:hypothetical protein AB3X91_05770 [Paraburkholderia sp. BR14263]|uniref:hypothetical protein n=1 Tax=unclassified Paraburkholderia TaxID=2615204 RepID=UPI0034CFEA7F
MTTFTGTLWILSRNGSLKCKGVQRSAARNATPGKGRSKVGPHRFAGKAGRLVKQLQDKY